MIDRHDLRADRSRPRRSRIELPGAPRSPRAALHFDARGALHDVRVGDDVAIGSTMTPEPLLRSSSGSPRRLIVFVGRGVAGDEDLHDARADALRQILKRPRQLGQPARG